MSCRSSAAGTVNGCASDLEHGFKARVHFLFFDKLAALGRRYSLFHGGQETGFFVKIAGNNTRHQPLRDSAGLTGDLRKPCLLFRGEMYFHAVQDTGKRLCVAKAFYKHSFWKSS
jgi:hypothetical protein